MSGFPVPLDIIFFGLFAVALGWRLYVVIGRRVKVEVADTFYRKPFAVLKGAPPSEVVKKLPETRRVIPQAGTRVGLALTEMRQKFGKFEPVDFADTAGKLFQDVVRAFAEGRLTTLEALLGAEIFAVFKQEIEARHAGKQLQTSEIVALEEISLVDAGLVAASERPVRAFIDVRFLSRQVNFLTQEDKTIVSGTESITEFSELWRFERPFDAASEQGSWRVVATRAA